MVLVAALALLTDPLVALPRTPTAEQLLERYDRVMGPENYEALAEMTAHREDGTTRTYKMRVLKAGADKLRIWFTEPPAVGGTELLRKGESVWVYVPTLKRATRVASRESFQGGDFRNTDVLRVVYRKDYRAQLMPASELPDTWELALRPRTAEAAYDRIRLWLTKPDGLPARAEYYDDAGTLLRVAEFSDVRNFGGLYRPSRVVMKNMIATRRSSEMVVSRFNPDVRPSAAKFVVDGLGR
jgi:outer membrane lipoprotein-sorting protein